MSLWDQVSNTERDGFMMTLIGAFPTSDVPHHLRTELVQYFADGVLPKNPCLQAILCNDLRAAVGSCAPQVEARIVPFLEAYAPAKAWGSRDRVLGWAVSRMQRPVTRAPSADEDTCPT